MSVQVMEAYVGVKKALFSLWDTGYAEGLDEDFMLADSRVFVAEQFGGKRMDAVVEQIWKEWKEQR